MKVRDSGMPEQEYWESLFDVPLILEQMAIRRNIELLVEFGCGYGTFTLPSAQIIDGKVVAFDIEEQMLESVNMRILPGMDGKISLLKRDFVSEGSGIETGTADYVMLFNILHHAEPLELLKEAYRILKPHGKAGLIHWNYDRTTPRGPEMSIRPKPESMGGWAMQAGFTLEEDWLIDLPPFHYGLIGHKF